MTYSSDLRAAQDAATDAFITKAVADATGPLQTQLAQAQTDLGTALTNLSQARSDLSAAQTQLASANDRIAGLNDQVDSLLARIAELEAQIPDPVQPLLWGASATANSARGTTSDLAEFQRLQTISGKNLARRTFETVIGTKATVEWSYCKASADIANGVTASVISWKVDWTKVASTDTTVLASQRLGWKRLIESMPLDHLIYATIHHEMDPEVDPATYIRGYRNWSAWIDEFRGERKIVKFWCPTGWAFYSGNGDSTRVAERWYPGDDVVEMVAADCYNRSTTKYNALSSEITGAPGAYRFAKAHGKRFGLPEFGCYDLTGTRRVDFIKGAKAWLDSLDGPKCEFALWFHSAVGATEDPSGFWLDTTQASLDAWKSIV